MNKKDMIQLLSKLQDRSIAKGDYDEEKVDLLKVYCRDNDIELGRVVLCVTVEDVLGILVGFADELVNEAFTIEEAIDYIQDEVQVPWNEEIETALYHQYRNTHLR